MASIPDLKKLSPPSACPSADSGAAKAPAACSAPPKPQADAKKAEAERPVLANITVTYNDAKSNIQEVWDLWINERPIESMAWFDIATTPAGYNPVQYTAWVQGPAGKVRDNLAVTTKDGPSRACTVVWDGNNDAGNKVPVGDNYTIHLKAQADGKEGTNTSRKTKVVRVGITSLSFDNCYPL
ncbi:hypothetical protein EG829_33845, partial [bacterium]|nr:hypothetical protein [bacterium]